MIMCSAEIIDSYHGALIIFDTIMPSLYILQLSVYRLRCLEFSLVLLLGHFTVLFFYFFFCSAFFRMVPGFLDTFFIKSISQVFPFLFNLINLEFPNMVRSKDKATNHLD